MQRLLLVFWTVTVPEGGGGGPAFTVSVATVVVADPAEFVNTARYRLLFCDKAVVKLRVAEVTPETGLNVTPPSVLTCHCTVGVGEPVAAAVKAAMRDAGIWDPSDVHYVQTKTPLLTIASVRDAERRGHHVACEVHDSMGVSNGTTALGIAVGLGEIKMPRAEQICRNLDLYSSVASCSSGVELTQAQIVLIGNKAGAGGRYRIGHAVMKDALDIDAIYAAIRNAGLDLPERPRAEDLGGRVINCFMKCEADRRGTLRGRRQIMLDDSDVHHHRHAKAAVGGVAAAAIGDPAVFVSVDAMHQGPQGGGPVIAIIDAGE